ncbi:hypothetical protein [Niabella ginsenosidivorans]|uniref:hypothetical protein n=1 Tax=Niabella ginsenosidivorans TaxID=1176587 RepID=UPI0012ECCCEF|nr:hypothetical protein [Niabella ginsenosidivorans]
MNSLLIKNTMQELRTLSASEINNLKNNVYTGILLLGYYQKGDTPLAIQKNSTAAPG